LATSTGTVTNAVHGFVGMLTAVLRDHRPGALAVAFDRPTPTFRDAIVPDYKGNRPEVPEALGPQFDLVRAVLDALGICTLDLDGFEADDILATLATYGRDAGRDVVVVSGDRDTFQLVEDPHVAVLYTRRGLSDTVRYDEAGIEERYGVPPALYPLLAALRGDPSDNLAGVPGVGEKTAARLAAKYKTLDALFEHADEQTPKLRQNLHEFEEVVRRNAGVIPLVRDAPVGVELDDLALGRWDLHRAERLFADLELRGAWQRLRPVLDSPIRSVDGDPNIDGDPSVDGNRSVDGNPSMDGDSGADQDRGFDGEHRATAAAGGMAAAGSGRVVAVPATVVPDTPEAAVATLQHLTRDAVRIAVAGRWQGEPGRAPLRGMAVAALVAKDSEDSDEVVVDHTVVWLPASFLTGAAGGLPAYLGALLGADGLAVVGHAVKELMRSLLPLGIDIATVAMDTSVAAFLVDPGMGRSTVADLVRRWYQGGPEPAGGQLTLPDPPSDAHGMQSGTRAGIRPDADADTAAEVVEAVGAARDIAAVVCVVGPLQRELAALGMESLHEGVEEPLVRVLARMEVAGVGVDVAELQRIADDMAEQGRQLQAEMHRLAGGEFNVNSTPQLRQVLYGTLGLTPGKKTKTGYSTDAQTLERLRGAHPIVEVLLRYREVEKLRSTYGESLLAEVAGDGRIHATFHQTVARTGRLSSDRPNLHNIPVRSPQGMALRRAFVPAPGARLLVADYDQIELRIIAHLASDPGLLHAFAGGRDVHRATAAAVFGVPEESVTPAQRSRAKMVSYGLAYGMEAFGLAQRLGIGTDEARQILDAYFVAFPGVHQYMEDTVARARELGYTATALGRRRPLPDLRSPNRGLRQAAERQAMNAGIQGMAADLFKMALVKLDRALVEQVPSARLVLQVHDEVLVEATPADDRLVEDLVVGIMTGVGPAAGLSVPLEVSAAWGNSWGDAKR